MSQICKATTRMKSEPLCSKLLCLLSLTVLCEFLIVAANVENGQNFVRKYHGISIELAAHFIGSFVVYSKIKCGLECDRQNCELMHYSTASRSCNLYNKYMSDDQTPIDGLYAKIGAVDISITCPQLPAPDHGSIGSSGSSTSSILGSSGLFAGTVIWYWCEYGYNLYGGDGARICGTDGTWSGSQPTCASYWTQTAELHVNNGEDFGTWGNVEFCANGTYAYGYDMKIKPNSGFSDDSALNAIKLHCTSLDQTQEGGSITSSTEHEGAWQGSRYCGYHTFMKSFSLQVESTEGVADDTAANFVKFRCRDFASTTTAYEMYIDPGQGLWGEYGSWSNGCGAYRAICGIRTRVHAHETNFDATALNDVIMYCC